MSERTIEHRAVDASALAPCAIDFAQCDAVEIVAWLHEHEKPFAHRMDTWPSGLRADIERAVADVLARLAPRALKGVTMAVVPARKAGANAVVLLHIERAKA